MSQHFLISFSSSRPYFWRDEEEAEGGIFKFLLLKGEGLLVVWKMMAIHAFSNRGVSMLKNCETSFLSVK